MKTGNLYLKHIIFFSTILFYSCQKKKSGNFDFEKVKKEIIQAPIKKRIAKWDSLIKLHKYDTLAGYLYYQRGYTHYFLSKNREAIKDFKKAIKLFKIRKNKALLAKSYIYTGSSYNSLGEQDIASQYILRGLNLAQKIDKPEILSLAYSELSQIFFKNKDYDKSIEYLNKSAGIYKEINDTPSLIMVYNNIAMIYLNQKRNREALDYFLKIKELNPKESDVEPYNLAILYYNLGHITYDVTKNKERALKYLDKSLEISRKNGIKPIFAYQFLASIFEKTNQLDSAKYYAKKSIIINKNDDYKELVNSYDILIRLSLKQKNDTFLLKLIKIKDSLNTLNHETVNKNNQKVLKKNIMLLDQQKELLQAKKINKKNKIIFIFIIIVFILGLIISFQFNRFDILKHKQELIVLEQKILRSQMSPHFIFNVLSSIQNSLLENNPVVSATYLSKFAKLMRQNFDYIQKKQIKLTEELGMLRNYLETQKFRFKDKFNYQINVDKELSDKDYFVPPMILQPFVENAIKHGFANISYKGLITINVLKKDDRICFEIIDNGTGYMPPIDDDKEHALSIFKKRLFILGKDAYDSFKISRLEQGTKVEFCFQVIKK